MSDHPTEVSILFNIHSLVIPRLLGSPLARGVLSPVPVLALLSMNGGVWVSVGAGVGAFSGCRAQLLGCILITLSNIQPNMWT